MSPQRLRRLNVIFSRFARCTCIIDCAVILTSRAWLQVLTELVGDKSLERFRQEYEKLHRALKKSHESEKRLIKKCECLLTQKDSL